MRGFGISAGTRCGMSGVCILHFRHSAGIISLVMHVLKYRRSKASVYVLIQKSFVFVLGFLKEAEISKSRWPH